METLFGTRTAVTQDAVSATDASYSAIGRSTAIDYNLGSMHKNGIIVVNQIVALRPIEAETRPTPTPESCDAQPSGLIQLTAGDI